jgi:uncharacterized hydrophobic protein (TIGR00271 family)
MSDKKTFWDKVKVHWRAIISMTGELDTVSATEKISKGINVRGTTVWILVCSIIIASVGLNINSIPVIIGAMLISPLMGPIFGMGLSLYTNDRDLLVNALKNFLVMVVVSIVSSTLYFLLSPLKMANPTELLARTSPTLYDVFIAFAGGIAGMLEQTRKERGVVLSGVAIATALMPPLCTAGFGIASGNFHYFFGALYLFLINTIFILLASYVTARYMHFDRVSEENQQNRSFRTISTIILIAIIVPSVLSAITMIRDNNIQRDVAAFVEENKAYGNAYIYDYDIAGSDAVVYFAGDLTAGDLDFLYNAARRHNLDTTKLSIKVNAVGARADELLKGVYARSDEAIAARDARIKELESQLSQTEGKAIPYGQVTRELKYKYPSVSSLSISRGSRVVMKADSLSEVPVTNAIIQSSEVLSAEQIAEITRWLRLRLDDTTIVANNIIESE